MAILSHDFLYDAYYIELKLTFSSSFKIVGFKTINSAHVTKVADIWRSDFKKAKSCSSKHSAGVGIPNVELEMGLVRVGNDKELSYMFDFEKTFHRLELYLDYLDMNLSEWLIELRWRLIKRVGLLSIHKKQTRAKKRTSTLDSDYDSEFDSDNDSEYDSDKSVDYLSLGEEEMIELRNRMKANGEAKAKAVKDVMPNAKHMQCARHIYENFKKHYSRLEFRNLFWASSKASYSQLFNKIMDTIKSANPNAHKYLMDKNPKTWSIAFFEVDRGCEAVENGFSECFNSVIVGVRHKSLITMLEAIRVIVLEKMNKMREISVKWNPGVCPNIKKRLECLKEQQMFWHVILDGGNLFEVRSGSEGFRVDEGNKTCIFKMWRLSGIPCAYATKLPQGSPQPIINLELPLIRETKPLFKMARSQCNKFRGDKGKVILPKGPKNATWYKDKAMLAEAQEAGQILDEEQLAFLADPGVLDAHAVQTIIPNNAAFQTEDLDTYDSDCDDISNAKAVLMANISNYGSDVISEVPHSETYLSDMKNQSVHAMQDFEQSPVVDFSDNEIHSDSNMLASKY
ncbi:hypothetical protein Tco_0871825 [Tanacetum coccineum]